ncbi:MAG: alpha-L-fucosidase, partial [Pyrinomonadaceae bacterium]
LVSGRVGNGVGDYDSAGDNQISVGKIKRDWETPVTMNDTWGFKRDDMNWKPTSILIRQMVQVASRGGNYLLNIGPTAEGAIPQPSVDRLTEVGKWINVNSDAVYGTGPSPFPYELPWGIITTKPGKVYLHVFEWPKKELVLYGLKSKIRNAYLLSGKTKLKFLQKDEAAQDHYAVTISLPPSAPDGNDSVIVLETKGDVAVDSGLLQQPDNSVTLPAFLSTVHIPPDAGLRFDSRGVAERWLSKDEWVEWDFKVSKPDTFYVVVLTSEQKYGRDWEGDHSITIETAGQKLQGKISNDGKEENPANPYWKYVISKIGQVKVEKSGKYNLSLKPDTIRSEKKLGLTLVSVKLVPVRK